MNSGFDQQYHSRRRSFSGGYASGGGFAPPAHGDGGYRRDGFNDRGGFNDSYNNGGFQEVSGPPPYPPPGMPQGRPPPLNMSSPDSLPPPPPPSQPFPSGGPGSFPSSMGMPSPYPMGTREPYSSSPYDSGMNSAGLPPPSGPPAYSNSHDSSPLSDNQYALDDNFSPRGRTLSTGGGFNQQALVPTAPPMTPYPSHSHYSAKRTRRASSIGPGGMGYAGIVGDPFRRPGGHVTVKFRLKGATHSGISVSEALERVRLSQGNSYLLHDVSMDASGKISLRIRVRLISSRSPHRLADLFVTL
jgi:uncharacterized protein DUF6741